LQSGSTLGIAQSRGERPYQEDFVAVASLHLSHAELAKTNKRAEHYQKLIANNQAKYRTRTAKGTEQHLPQNHRHCQSLFVGVIDGHGGTDSAEFLANNLPRIIEQSHPDDIPNVIRTYRSIGGYFRRFRGGFLEEIARQVYDHPPKSDHPHQENHQGGGGEQSTREEVVMGVDERLSLSFLLADQQLINSCPKSGAVATAVILTPLPVESEESQTTIYPYFSSPLLSLIIGHVGDTSGLLCSAVDGKVVSLTENHHPDSRVESDRLRRIGTGLITDSFGESRWGGSLANSRGLGDASFKSLGVTGEPDIVNRIINGMSFFHLDQTKNIHVSYLLRIFYSLPSKKKKKKKKPSGEDWEFLILVSDGISNVITNQEIIDLCKRAKTPTEAANRVVEFAETLGG
jgi:protein phosphatase PTC6